MGKVPAILDDTDTDVDEYAEHKFSFAPYVYRQRYERDDGAEAAYYVMDFTVGE